MRIVVPSVNYADLLAVTLPAWRRMLMSTQLSHELIVVTSPEDHATRSIAHENHVTALVTDAWGRDGAVFNKAAALDEAFGFGVKGGVGLGEWCLSIDADVFPFGGLPWGQIERAKGAGVLFGANRYACHTPLDLQKHIDGRMPLGGFQEIHTWSRSKHRHDPAGRQGYFQLWQHRAGDSFGSFPTAAKYDVKFSERFQQHHYLDHFYVLHLGEHRKNWSGRVTPGWGSDS
jgi:hypothetical protein